MLEEDLPFPLCLLVLCIMTPKLCINALKSISMLKEIIEQ